MDLKEFLSFRQQTRSEIPNRYFHIKKLNFSNYIEFRNIKFSYPNSNKKVLDLVNLKIHKSELLGIYGPNGSGKSTFIEIIMGLIEPNIGEILVDGINLYACQDKNLIYRYRASISYVSQAVFIGEKTILEYITYEVNQNNVNTEKLEKLQAIRY